MLRDTVKVLGVEMKDYAYPTIQAERCLKDLHDAVLDKKWDKAHERSKEVIKWVWEIQEALFEMRKVDEA
jgi:hypothetical protein